MSDKKKLLYEVSYIRPIVIFLLVFMHSFTKVKNIETSLDDAIIIEPYKWLINFIRGFRIETIAFVAGYVFSYQVNDLGRKYDLIPFAKNKFQRLIIPMLFFSTIYYFMFIFNIQTFTISGCLLSIFSGCGHLWFLPMLFWCFVSIWFFDHYKLISFKILILLATLTLLPVFSLPLGFNKLPHFLFYVYSGYYLWLKKNYILSFFSTKKRILLLVLSYILLVIIEEPSFFELGYYGNYLWKHIIILIKASIGILSIYTITYNHTSKPNFIPNKTIVNASNICYGVYIYHQFILMWLYCHTPFYDIFGKIWTPLVGFIITSVLSILFTKLTLKTRFGRFLIG